MADTDELARMLALAALTYRGFASTTSGEHHGDRLRQAVCEGLGDIQQLNGRYDLVWGPESYRSKLSVFDDAMMFVVRDKSRSRYVVAVRGTNPISAFDWVLGDLWVSRPVPFSSAPAGAMLSMSTALGLVILLNLTSAGGGCDAVSNGGDKAAKAAGHRVADDIVTHLRDLASAVGTKVSDVVKGLSLKPIPILGPGGALDRGDDELIGCIRSARAACSQMKAIEDALHQRLYDHLTADVVARRSENDGRRDLRTFLQAAVDKESAVEIVVTGHSKGGALAPALALWLHEALRTVSRPETSAAGGAGEQGIVHCVAFAGPSPGNKAFADRFEKAIGTRFDRVVNKHDIVPRAWHGDTLAAIRELYEGGPECPGLLADMVDEIAADVRPLGYTHLDVEDGPRTTPLTPPLNRNVKSFAAQMIHQHLDGYCEALGLAQRMNYFFS